MTLDPTLPKASYQGNGIWKDPVVPFRIFSEEEILVQREDRDPASANYGVLTTLTRGVDYTVEINVAGDGGFVHLSVAPTTLQGILITSNSVIEQGRSYGGGGAFPSKSHEAALDKLTRISQELSMRQGLALRFPDQDPDSMSPVLPPAAQRVGKVMAFGPNGELSVGDPGGFVGQIETMRDEAVAASSLATTAAGDAGVAQIAAEAAQDAAETAAAEAASTVANKLDKSMFTAAWDFIVGSGAATAVKKTLAEVQSQFLALVGAWTRQQYAPPVTITPTAGAVTLDADLHQNCKITSTVNLTMNAPDNAAEGKMLFVRLYAATALTITWNAAFVKNADKDLPTAHTAGKDMFLQFYYDGVSWVLLGGSERA